MSWSVSAIGKASAVAAKIAADIERQKCMEPEEAIKKSVASALAAALAAFPEGSAVKVEASGSQSATGAKATNNLSVSLQPLYGFVE